MIEAVQLVKHYVAGKSSRVEALRGVSFHVGPGEILGYLGPNGAGKSTTVKILTGLQPASSGRAVIGGYDIATQPLEAKRLIGLVPESGAVYEALTPVEYLRFVGNLYEMSPRDLEARITELLEFLQLDRSAWSRRMQTFSKGMKQRVVIAAAVLHRPQVLFFDEPLNGLDVDATVQVKQLIAREAAAGRTILYCSHILDVVERICSRILILAEGRVRVDGSLEDIRNQHPGRTLEWIFQDLTGRGSESRLTAAEADTR